MNWRWRADYYVMVRISGSWNTFFSKKAVKATWTCTEITTYIKNWKKSLRWLVYLIPKGYGFSNIKSKWLRLNLEAETQWFIRRRKFINVKMQNIRNSTVKEPLLLLKPPNCKSHQVTSQNSCQTNTLYCPNIWSSAKVTSNLSKLDSSTVF